MQTIVKVFRLFFQINRNRELHIEHHDLVDRLNEFSSLASGSTRPPAFQTMLHRQPMELSQRSGIAADIPARL